MKLVKADMFEHIESFDYICITTNAMTKSDGNLVMGAGVALKASKLNPNLKISFGKQIRERSLVNRFYGLLLADEKYIAFQTKLHWRDSSPLDVVARSCDMLKRLAEKYPSKTFALPFPAISNGCRTPSEILPFLLPMPDNVTVFHLQDLNL